MPLPAEVVNFFQSIPASPGGAATGSTSGIQCGFGIAGSFVPNSSASALITISGTLANNTASDGAFAGISIGTGAPPTLGATPIGAVGYPARITNNASTAAVPFPFTMQAIVTGLTLGVGYWIDMQLGAVTGGTATPGNVQITALEL